MSFPDISLDSFKSEDLKSILLKGKTLMTFISLISVSKSFEAHNDLEGLL